MSLDLYLCRISSIHLKAHIRDSTSDCDRHLEDLLPFVCSISIYYCSHTTTDALTGYLLAHLITRDDAVRQINVLLVVILETESNCANSSERRALEYFNQLHPAAEG